MYDAFDVGTTVITPDFAEECGQLKAGNYLCTILEYQVRTSAAGNKYILWKLDTGRNTVVFHSTPIEGKGAGIFKQFVHATGNEIYQSGPIDLKEFSGKKVMCNLFYDEYLSNGQKRIGLKVKKVWKFDPSIDTEHSEDVPF